MRDSAASMKDVNKTYAIVEVIDGEKLQLVRLVGSLFRSFVSYLKFFSLLLKRRKRLLLLSVQHRAAEFGRQKLNEWF